MIYFSGLLSFGDKTSVVVCEVQFSCKAKLWECLDIANIASLKLFTD